WIFYRAQSLPEFTSLGQLRGKRVSIGARGSGTPGLFMRLLAANQIEREELQRSLLAETEAVAALLDGKLDATVLVSAPEAPMVQMLLQRAGHPALRIHQRRSLCAPLSLHQPGGPAARRRSARA